MVPFEKAKNGGRLLTLSSTGQQLKGNGSECASFIADMDIEGRKYS